MVNEEAFGQPAEAAIVDRLRESCPDSISLIATVDGEIVGHILFTPVTIEAGDREVRGMGLAPMAVLPQYQRRGVGTRLVETGLGVLREHRCLFVIVLGHPEYCPRFGFVPASQYGITCQWEGIPDAAFMIQILNPSAMEGVAGVARYRSEFDAAM